MKRTENDIKKYYAKILKDKFAKLPLDLIEKVYAYSRGEYKMSTTEAVIYGVIDYFSRLDNHCYTSSTRLLQEVTGACRRTVARALKRLEENKIILKLETTTTVPYYVTYELYYARIYHWVVIKGYYPEEVENPEKPYVDIVTGKTREAGHSDVALLMRRLNVENVNIKKELRTAQYYTIKQKQPTYY